jgi:glycosyltransferase involved in cell wall biosynthesis
VTTQADVTDLVFMGELRPVKGVDVLIDAIALLLRDGRTVGATLVGDGPERDALRAQVERLGLSAGIRFMPAMPARQALTLGRIMVVPSRAESLPYVVLEAAASGMPIITTKVGGIPEIYGPLSDTLVPPENSEALAKAIARAIDHPDATSDSARRLRERVAASFSVDTMVDGVLNAYQAALERLRENGRR